MHQDLRRFGMEGSINDDSDFIRLRAQYESLVIQNMRGKGFVPVLGMGPFFSTEYNLAGNLYEFTLSLHGVFVGKDKAWQIEGVDLDGTMRPRSTARPKSNQ